MNNPTTGNVVFSALGREWNAILDTNARASMEDAFGKGTMAIVIDLFGDEIITGSLKSKDDGNIAPLTPEKQVELTLAAVKRFSISTVRSVLYHALRSRQPDIDINVVGNIIDAVGDQEAVSLIMKLLMVSAPDNTEGGDAPGNQSPAKKQSGAQTG
jgi:hypothetical protein